MDKIIMWGLIILILIGVIAAAVALYQKRRELFFMGSPDRLVYREGGLYTGMDFGFGTPIFQTTWSRPGLWQPWVPVDTGLYGCDGWWSPRLRMTGY